MKTGSPGNPNQPSRVKYSNSGLLHPKQQERLQALQSAGNERSLGVYGEISKGEIGGLLLSSLWLGDT